MDQEGRFTGLAVAWRLAEPRLGWRIALVEAKRLCTWITRGLLHRRALKGSMPSCGLAWEGEMLQ
jgi:hypothetical protein